MSNLLNPFRHRSEGQSMAPPRLHTPRDGAIAVIAPTHRERRAAKRLAYATARQARAARPGARGWRRACGGHVPWVEAPPEYRGTTVQVCGLWPFSAGSGTPTDGVPLGKHQLTGATVCGDPIMWFLSRRILNPSAFVLGRPGLGKSTLVRRIVNVSAAFGIIPLILSDLKPDYPDLVRALGGQVIEVGPERGHVNPLDPGPLAPDLHRLPEATRRRVAAEQVGRALNVLTGLCELVRGGPLTDREGSMLSASLREAYTQQTAPLIEDVVIIIAARHPRVRAMSLDRGEDSRYDDTVENLLASLMALGPDGRFGDTFSRPTTVPMLLDRAVVFDVSGIDTAETKLQAGVQLVCWSYGQSAVSAAKELAEAGLRERTIYLMIMDELWRTLKAAVEMVDRVDEITRLNRQKVLGQVLITHTMDDLELADAAATKKAWGFVERSEMVFLGGLADGEMGNLRKVFAMSAAETGMIADWSVESAHTADDDNTVTANTVDGNTVDGTGNGEPPPPPGLGKFLLKTGKKPGTPFEVVLTGVEKAVNNTNKGWEVAEARHRIGRQAVPS